LQCHYNESTDAFTPVFGISQKKTYCYLKLYILDVILCGVGLLALKINILAPFCKFKSRMIYIS